MESDIQDEVLQDILQMIGYATRGAKFGIENLFVTLVIHLII